VGARFGVYGSYDGEFTGLGTAMTGELTAAVREREGTPEGLRLLQRGAVDYAVAAIGHEDRLRLPLAEELPSVYECPLRLLRVEHTLPRISVVDAVAVEPPAGAMAALLDAGLDPSRSVLLSPPAGRKAPSPSFRGAVRLLSRRTDRLEIAVETSSVAHVVVREAFAAGWRARVDGRPAPVLRADVLFRAVEVPAGRHEVELFYRPQGAALGLVISATGLLVLVLLGSRRRRPVAAPAGGG
jgi:hypothetical protein